MKTAVVQTRCECQGRLSATLDEAGLVISGSASATGGDSEKSPATAMNAGQDLFQIGWSCPLCGRNTVRSFHKGVLRYQEPA